MLRDVTSRNRLQSVNAHHSRKVPDFSTKRDQQHFNIIMAEVAAGLVVAEEVVSTTVQAGAATYAVAKPTMPLKATFTQIAAAKDEETRSNILPMACHKPTTDRMSDKP